MSFLSGHPRLSQLTSALLSLELLLEMLHLTTMAAWCLYQYRISTLFLCVIGQLTSFQYVPVQGHTELALTLKIFSYLSCRGRIRGLQPLSNCISIATTTFPLSSSVPFRLRPYPLVFKILAYGPFKNKTMRTCLRMGKLPFQDNLASLGQ